MKTTSCLLRTYLKFVYIKILHLQHFNSIFNGSNHAANWGACTISGLKGTTHTSMTAPEEDQCEMLQTCVGHRVQALEDVCKMSAARFGLGIYSSTVECSNQYIIYPTLLHETILREHYRFA